MALWIYAHNNGSEGATALKDALGIRKIRHEGSRFVGSPRHTVINWGAGQLTAQIERSRVLNRSEHVRTSANKLSFFRKMGRDNPIVPPWTESFDVATQ